MTRVSDVANRQADRCAKWLLNLRDMAILQMSTGRAHCEVPTDRLGWTEWMDCSVGLGSDKSVIQVTHVLTCPQVHSSKTELYL